MIDSDYLKKMNIDKSISISSKFYDTTHVAEYNGVIVGIASFGVCRDEDLEHSGEIVSIYVLKEYKKKGIGSNAKIRKEDLKYIDSHGHEIGNHSYTHPDFKRISFDEAMEEIEKTQQIIYETILKYPRVFRFPYGSINHEVMAKVEMPSILWSADSLDWQYYDSQIVLEILKKEIKENGTILFHDFKYYNRGAIIQIIKDLKEEGYTFVTVSELFGFSTDE